MLYVRLILVAACPVAASAVLYLLNKRTAFGKLKNRTKQILYGLIFGIFAVMGSEFGVHIEGAVINVRDTAPLCAGLIFGAPAGIIAGLIGGLERWFSVYWGGGVYTRFACSVSTCIAGLFGAALRKWMFDDKKPSWHYGFAAGLVMEVFHMLMIFFSNFGDVEKAFSFVERCSLPMILTNSFSVMFAVLAVSLLGKEKLSLGKEHRKLTQSFSRWLLAIVMIAFVVTGLFIYFLQTNFSNSNNVNVLQLNLEDVKADIRDASDQNLLKLARTVADDLNRAEAIDNSLLMEISSRSGNDFSEINVINDRGVIVYTTNPQYMNFRMDSGEQSGAFLPLLEGEKEFVQSYQPVTHDTSVSMKYAGVALDKGGFVQVGYDSERFRRDIDIHVIGATNNRHVGKNGYIIIAGEDWNIVSAPYGHEGRNLEYTGIWIDLDTMPPYERFKAQVYGEESYCMYAVTEGYYIIAVEPVSEVVFSRNLSVYVTVFMEILVFAALFILIYYLIKKLVVENIHEINHTLKEITGGNLNVSVDVRTNEEFISLSDDINTTVFTLKGYIAEAAARIDKELEVAKVIQSSTLPGVFPPYPDRTEFDIFATMDPAKEVGGDFYDFYLLDENRLAFLIADVSGKGITAAMFMMKAKTLIKDYAEKEKDAAEILTKANDALCEGNDAEMFVTCWLGILDFSKHTVDFANAGHNPPLIKRKDGRFEYLKTRPGFVLGGMEGIIYRQEQLKLEPGDEIFLYTDGVTEATDEKEELYGDHRLLETLNSLECTTAEETCHGVKADVDLFVGGAAQFDDITMLSLKLLLQNDICISPTVESIGEVQNFVESTLENLNVAQKNIAEINIAADEIYSNIVHYSGADEVTVSCNLKDGTVNLVFTDDGKPYDSTKAPQPDLSLDAEEREPGGLGIYMVRKLMDEVSYQYRDNKNILILKKRVKLSKQEIEKEK